MSNTAAWKQEVVLRRVLADSGDIADQRTTRTVYHPVRSLPYIRHNHERVTALDAHGRVFVIKAEPGPDSPATHVARQISKRLPEDPDKQPVREIAAVLADHTVRVVRAVPVSRGYLAQCGCGHRSAAHADARAAVRLGRWHVAYQIDETQKAAAQERRREDA